MSAPLVKIRVSVLVLFVSIILCFIKFYAFYITSSKAILSDAYESIVNILAGAFSLYSIWISSKPRDKNHPYGHGKIEFISAGMEGVLIMVAALSILYESINGFLFPYTIENVEMALYLSGLAGIINFLSGHFLQKTGEKHQSISLIADGKHLKSDAYTSFGLIGGLIIVKLTGIIWLDSLMAGLLGLLLLKMGVGLIKKAYSGVMDEANEDFIKSIKNAILQKKEANWIDIHRLRVIDYGHYRHVDMHITFPFFQSLKDCHDEMEKIEKIIDEKLKGEVDFFIHPEPCEPNHCNICKVEKCDFRNMTKRH